MTHDHYNNRKNQLLLAFAIALMIYYFAGCSVAYGQDTLRIVPNMWGGKIQVFDTVGRIECQEPKTQWMILAEHWENYKRSLSDEYERDVKNNLYFYSAMGYGFTVVPDSNGIFIYSKKLDNLWIERKKPALDGFMKYLECK